MSKPEAVFDLLFVGNRLQEKIGDFSLSEIYFFSYLSCLLSIYDGGTVDKWNYSFIKSNLGSPYSSDIQIALKQLIANESLAKADGPDGYFRITEKGKTAIEFYSKLSTMSGRTKYLDTACNCLSLIPYGTVKNAMAFEPVLTSARNSISKRNLLEEDNPATRSLRIQFASLKKALEDQFSDLLLPAVIWLESLTDNNLNLQR